MGWVNKAAHLFLFIMCAGLVVIVVHGFRDGIDYRTVDRQRELIKAQSDLIVQCESQRDRLLALASEAAK